ncbi:unnamed protein product [Mytilus coruscus]|uniref:Uncharacterized protein n=1 Tax=Mytilus coruscus TaxID=42192 RepID=A0A6J8EJF0_MYTCO|nr:unnamed protein product [Mytilus coruscus]
MGKGKDPLTSTCFQLRTSGMKHNATATKSTMLTTTLPPPTTFIPTIPTTASHAHVCDKFRAIQSLVTKTSVSAPTSRGCLDGTNSADALLISYCSAPEMSMWKRGRAVISSCASLPTYIPIGKIRHGHFTDISGIMTYCHSNGVIEIIEQSCGTTTQLKNITSPSSNSYEVIMW